MAQITITDAQQLSLADAMALRQTARMAAIQAGNTPTENARFMEGYTSGAAASGYLLALTDMADLMANPPTPTA
jgi:hypothetical protein